MLNITEEEFKALPLLSNYYDNIKVLDANTIIKKSNTLLPTNLDALVRTTIPNCGLPLDYTKLQGKNYLYSMPKIPGKTLCNYQFTDLQELAKVMRQGFHLLKEFHQNSIIVNDIHESNIMYDTNRRKVGFIDFDDAGTIKHPSTNIFNDAIYYATGNLLDPSNKDELLLNDKLVLLHTYLSAISTGKCCLDIDDTITSLKPLSNTCQKYLKDIITLKRPLTEADYLDSICDKLTHHKNLVYKKNM
jgi:serine/threonine protein kinase